MLLGILEEMSIGLSKVTSNIEGNINTVKYGITGYLYDLNNIEMVIKYIKKLALDESFINVMAFNKFKGERKFFSTFNMISNYEHL